MSGFITVTCNGDWHGFPCRGALSTPLLEVRISVDELKTKATAAGWRLTADGDLCPAHARRVTG